MSTRSIAASMAQLRQELRESPGKLITAGELVKKLRVVNFDVALDTKTRLESELGPVTCKPECSYCCYAKILSPTYIGVLIYLYLRGQGMWTPKLREHLVEYDKLMTVRSHAGWLMARRPCPFLKVKSFGRGTCSIYPARPEVCAVTFSVAPGDGSKCAIPHETNLVSILDERNLVPYLPVVMSIQDYCPPIITTLPGSVLVAEATLAGRPPPADIASVPFPDDEPDRGWAEREFDARFTTVPDGE